MTKNGTCGFCGQIQMIDRPEQDWVDLARIHGMTEQEVADHIAMETCKCKEGLAYRERMESLQIAQDIIEEMFRDRYPEIADMLQEIKAVVYGGKHIRKVTITMPGDAGVAMISYGKTGLKIEHRKVLHEEATTGF